MTEQGSGVKSLICLIADIISKKRAKLLLIDEPKLGLNPYGKHELLKFLLKQSKEKQVLIANHDPTFFNPILWNKENVSIYLYSYVQNDFVKIDLTKSKQDPNTFAGFLPHTTCLKGIHIYVEGTSDAYTLQIFLDKYLKKFRKWYVLRNKIGIFHLSGDFWCHLLYTIPKNPFLTIVILDGDKREEAIKVVEKQSKIEKNRFQFFDNLDELSKMKIRNSSNAGSVCPVYCLMRPNIEKYLTPTPKNKNEDPEAVSYTHLTLPTILLV